MENRLTVSEYLGKEETMRPQELAYGVVREPPAPGYGHQIVVGSVYRRLDAHVRRLQLGRVVVSPVDVVLDRERALVVQPDIVFVPEARLGICKERIWGAPDLVVEVLSSATRRRDSTVKMDWYGRYGVREGWLVDPVSREITVCDLTAADRAWTVVEGSQIVRSKVLPRLRLRVTAAFAER